MPSQVEMGSRRSRRTLVSLTSAAAAATLLLAGCSGPAEGAPGEDEGLTIYAFWPNTTTPAWTTIYIPSALSAIQEEFPDATIVEQIADNDPAKQLSQTEAAAVAGADLAVFAAANPSQAAGALRTLQDAEIPVVAYAHDPLGGEVASFVTVGFEQIGDTWGSYLAETVIPETESAPLRIAAIYGDPTYAVYNDWVTGITPHLEGPLAGGSIEFVCQADSKDWAPQAAQDQMEQCLTSTDNQVDAVLVMNDSTADGVWAALKSQGLNGTVPIYGGHDGSLTAVQRILAGDQIGTYVPDGEAMGAALALLLRAAYEGEDPESTGIINSSFDNDYVEGGVPTALIEEVQLTIDNVDYVIDAGIYTKEDICANTPAELEFCG